MTPLTDVPYSSVRVHVKTAAVSCSHFPVSVYCVALSTGCVGHGRQVTAGHGVCVGVSGCPRLPAVLLLFRVLAGAWRKMCVILKYVKGSENNSTLCTVQEYTYATANVDCKQWRTQGKGWGGSAQVTNDCNPYSGWLLRMYEGGNFNFGNTVLDWIQALLELRGNAAGRMGPSPTYIHTGSGPSRNGHTQ
jgi:hypothetical protein